VFEPVRENFCSDWHENGFDGHAAGAFWSQVVPERRGGARVPQQLLGSQYVHAIRKQVGRAGSSQIMWTHLADAS
jgi:hypothetical protein